MSKSNHENMISNSFIINKFKLLLIICSILNSYKLHIQNLHVQHITHIKTIYMDNDTFGDTRKIK